MKFGFRFRLAAPVPSKFCTHGNAKGTDASADMELLAVQPPEVWFTLNQRFVPEETLVTVYVVFDVGVTL